ncbi:hypothetical protein D5086_022823, partial [Populus alba]
ELILVVRSHHHLVISEQLTSLYLSSNNFSGQIPSSLGNLIQLRSLFLNSNKLMGQVPDSLGSL